MTVWESLLVMGIAFCGVGNAVSVLLLTKSVISLERAVQAASNSKSDAPK